MRSLIALLPLMLIASCGGDEAAALVDARRAAARELIQSFATALQGELKGALESGGPVEAIAVCSERAPAIAAAAARDGLTVRRIGTRVRNTATNVPTSAERAILDRFAELPAAERATAFEERETDGHWSFYAPIFVAGPLCLTCHGPAESLAPPIREAIAQRYPQDGATGYAVGDLRGAFVVESRP